VEPSQINKSALLSHLHIRIGEKETEGNILSNFLLFFSRGLRSGQPESFICLGDVRVQEGRGFWLGKQWRNGDIESKSKSWHDPIPLSMQCAHKSWYTCSLRFLKWSRLGQRHGHFGDHVNQLIVFILRNNLKRLPSGGGRTCIGARKKPFGWSCLWAMATAEVPKTSTAN
jgi:hypothetical protein